MPDIMKHKRESCIVNLVLISVALVLEFLKLIRPAESVITQIDMLLCMAAMLPALLYILSGYRKSAAQFYKVFMYMFAASCLCSLANDVIYTIIDHYTAYFSTVVRALVFVGALLLAFIPNFGKRKSLGVAYGILALELVNSIRLVVRYGGNFALIVKSVSGVVIACVVCMFVLCKYADKDARGTI